MSTFGGQNLIKFISFENLSPILKIIKKLFFVKFYPLRSISDFEMFGM